MIAKISEVYPVNNNLTKIIVLDQLQDSDFSMLVNEFGYGKEAIEFSIKNYKNIAFVIKLIKKDEGLAEWKLFIDRHIPKKERVSKLDNVFVSKSYDKLLLVTNRRLASVDLKKLNEKIKKINTDIEILNDSFEKETKLAEKKGLISTIKDMFR